jgi:VWFA-related protein
MRRPCRLNLIAVLTVLSYTVGVIAAEHSFQSAPPASPKTITLNVLVIDKQNRPVNDLKREDFQLLEDETIQSISSFTTEQVPINYVLALDISRSVKAHFKQLVPVAKTIIGNNKPMDETFLIIFRGEAEAVLPHFTSDKAALMDSLNNVSRWVGGQSAILDAAYLSIEPIADYKKATNQANRHYALILITDGFENYSYYNEKDVLKRLGKEGIQVFVIGLTKYLRRDNPRLYEDQGKRAMGLLARLAQETGGYVFFPETDGELDKVAQDIESFMRTQYRISFNLKSSLKPGSYNKMKIKLIQKPELDQYTVIAPRGYTVPQQ